MANQTISTTFKVVDEMSPAFQKMNRALQSLDGSINDLEGDLNGIDSKEITALKDSVKETESAFSGLSKQAGGLGNTSTKFKNIASAAGQASHSVKDVSSGVSTSASNLKQINGSGFKQVGNAAQTATGAVNSLKSQTAQVDDELDELERDASGLSDKFSGLKTTVLGAVTAFASLKTAQAAISLSDEMTQTTSRLDLMNDGLQTTEELQQQIKKAALNSHAEYSTLADTVAKLGNNAGAAFSNTSEIVTFAEQLSKQFALSGASADEMAAATLQLTQGLGSGVLRGDEFNSVMEQAPGIAQMIADYLEVDKSQIRDLASEGALTADVVKNAIIGASDETNKKFDQMKVTFGQLWTDFKTNAMFAFVPVSEALSDIANNPKFQEAINAIGDGLVKLGEASSGLISTLGNFFVNSFAWLVENARFVIAGITGIAAAIGTLTAASAVSKAGGITDLIAKMGTALAKSGLAQTLLALINPATLAAAAIVGLGAATAAIMASGTSLEDVAKGFSNFDKQIQQFVDNFGSLIPTLVEGIKSKLPDLAAQAGSIMGTLVTGILNSGVNLIGAGVQIIIDLATGLAQAMPTIVSSGITFLTNLLNGIMQGLPSVAGTTLQVIGNIIGTIAENLPALLQAGIDTIQAFATGIAQNLPTIIAQAFVTISGFVQTISEHLPELITKGFELISNLVAGIIQNLPALLTTAVTLIGTFVGSIIENLPQILQAGISLVGSLVMGLIQSIPALLAGMGQLVGTILQSLADLIPQALNKMLEVGMNIVEGLKQGFMNAWAGIGDFFNAQFSGLVGGIKSLLGINSPSTEFAGMGENMVAGLRQGFDEKMPEAIDTINQAMAQLQEITQTQTNTLVDSITGQYNNLATTLQNQVTSMVNNLNGQWQALSNTCLQILTGFAQTMISAMTTLVTQVTSSWNNMNTTVNSIATSMSKQLTDTINTMVNALENAVNQLPGYFSNTATKMMDGFLSGINSKKDAVISATSELVQKLKETFETGLGIHSPSDYMIWVGQMMLAGLMEGMSPEDVQSFITSVVGDMQTSFSAGSFDAKQTVDFLSEQGTLDLIAKVTGMDLSELPQDTSIPGIIQAAQQNIGYINPGGRFNSKFGLQYGNGSDWCASFVRAMAEQAGVAFPPTNYVPAVREWAISNGRWTQSPASGYAVIFDYSGHRTGSHIGLVESVNGDGSITTIEGNTGGAQGTGVYRKNRSSQILGYVALDGGHGVGNSLVNALQNAYNAKYHPELLAAAATGGMGAAGGVGIVPNIGEIGYPLSSIVPITSLYGWRVHPVFGEGRGHAGIDLGASFGSPILSAMAGTVTSAGVNGGYGNAVIVSSGGLDILYGHMSQILASQGQSVSRGQQIGLVGSTGWSTGPHLHFEMRSGGGTIDPLDYLIAAGQTGYYTGTDSAKKGWALVGEKGPELVNFGGGEVVKNNSETNSILRDMASTGGYDYPGLINATAQNEAAMANGSAGPVNINVNNEIHNEGDLVDAESRITQTIARTIRRERKVTGGVPHAY